MGNAPSKEPQGRPPHKLSKTRVPNPNTAGSSMSKANGPSLQPPSPLSHDLGSDLISIPYSATANSAQADDDDDDDDSGDHKSTQPRHDQKALLSPHKPQQKRLGVFRSKSSLEPPERRRYRRNTVVGSPVLPSEGVSVSRALSVNAAATQAPQAEVGVQGGLATTNNRLPTARSRASWAFDPSSYEAQRPVNFGPEQPYQRPRSEVVPLPVERGPEDIRIRSRRRISLPPQPVSPPMTRSNSDMSLHPPMRRRSIIQTPGVATRTRPAPVPARSAKSSFRHSLPPTPSMSRQPSTEAMDCRVLSLPPLPTPTRIGGADHRVATPKEDDYSTTGAFKFGTLRITNGSPDLTPNVALILGDGSEKAQAGSPHEDYFSPLLRCEMHEKPPAVSSTASEARSETQLPSSFPQRRAAEAAIEQQLLIPALQTQSRQAAVDDDLFEDDSPLEIAVPEVLEVRLDPNAKSLSRPHDAAQRAIQAIGRSDSGFVSNSNSGSSKSRSSLAKADSGYSSNVSLRSFRNGQKTTVIEKATGRTSMENDAEFPKVYEQGARPTLEAQLPGAAAAEEGSDKAPTPPPKDEIPYKQASASCARDFGAAEHQTAWATPANMRRKMLQQQPSVIDTSKTGGPCLKASESVPITPASAKSDQSSSSLSIGNSPQKQGRLHRFLSLRNSPFAKQSLTVHATHAVDSQVPSIPKEVEDKLREHTGLFPMTTKRLALKSQMSKETLKTILSVGSLELAKDDDVPRTPAFLGPDEDDGGDKNMSGDTKESSLKHTFNSMHSNFRNAAASIMPNRKPIVRKPVAAPGRASQSRDAAQPCKEDSMLAMETELTSYHSINTSLGSNAYDVASRAMEAPTGHLRRSSSMTTSHDHYLQLRTMSLNGAVLGGLDDPVMSRSLTPRSGSPHKKLKTPPPVSFRLPPRRSPVRPQGPAVLPPSSRENVRTDPASSYTDGGPRGQSCSGFHHRKSSSSSVGGSNTLLGSRCASFENSRHSSISSVQSDVVGGSPAPQPCRQQYSSHDLKHRLSFDGCSRNQARGVYEPHPAHQGPAYASTGQPGILGPRSPSNSMHIMDANTQPGQQHAWLPPHVPRGHRRNYSGSGRQHAGQAPYRILHSYNSPAYRNAPIWG